jgi:hypothetical protein
LDASREPSGISRQWSKTVFLDQKGRGIMDRFAYIARHLAQMAIDQAVERGGDNDKIKEAKRELSRGDRKKDRGRYKDAVANYMDALSKADWEKSNSSDL